MGYYTLRVGWMLRRRILKQRWTIWMVGTPEPQGLPISSFLKT
jgi:hypothetical protein